MFYHVLKTNYPTAFNKEIGINTLSQVGMGLVEKGQFQNSLMFFEQNTIEFPNSARSHFELANVYIKIDEPEKAIEEYNKTLVLDPNHLRARQELEILLNKDKNQSWIKKFV